MKGMKTPHENWEKEPVKLYHGISSTQRGGDAAEKIRKMIDTGVIYPAVRERTAKSEAGRDTEDAMDQLHVAVFKHALKNGKERGKIDIGKYLRENTGDTEFMSNPAVKKYLYDDTFRKALEDFGFSSIDMERMMRTHATWTDEEESHIADTYGNEIYLEFTQDADTVHREAKGASTGIIPGPIDFRQVKRIVLAPRFALKAKEIEKKLHERGLENIRVEVGHAN